MGHKDFQSDERSDSREHDLLNVLTSNIVVRTTKQIGLKTH